MSWPTKIAGLVCIGVLALSYILDPWTLYPQQRVNDMLVAEKKLAEYRVKLFSKDTKELLHEAIKNTIDAKSMQDYWTGRFAEAAIEELAKRIDHTPR